VRKENCSICGQSYKKCPHIVGRAYMGRECHRIIGDVEILEVSLVDSPANKMARVIGFNDNEAFRGWMTWRELNNKS
jgi:hypothetical protein